MDISFILAVYNNLELTKEFYKRLRTTYPETDLVISSGGSDDGTMEWLDSLDDTNLYYTHTSKKLSFSENYNNGIKLSRTSKVVLVHNDMVIGKNFLENIDKHLTENILLCYTTIEPPIFAGHKRPGKVIMDLGSSFDNFNDLMFEIYVDQNKDKHDLYEGGVFFMSGYKKTFEDIGYFDGVTFTPAFCEDDDFLLRAKLKGYNLRTITSAIVYHFVSQTSRFSKEFIDERHRFEYNSNRNFIRKWGLPVSVFSELNYQKDGKFEYIKKEICLKTVSNEYYFIKNLEPYFDKINCGMIPFLYVQDEQKNTNYNLTEKFINFKECNIIVESPPLLQVENYKILNQLRSIIKDLSKGSYQFGEFIVTVN